MASRLKKPNVIAPVDIDINGETYQLRYGHLAYQQAELALTKLWGTRTTIPGLFSTIFNADDPNNANNRISVNEFTILLWAGMLHDMPDLQLQEVAEVIDPADLTQLIATVFNAIGVSLTKETPEVQGQNGEQKNDQMAEMPTMT